MTSEYKYTLTVRVAGDTKTADVWIERCTDGERLGCDTPESATEAAVLDAIHQYLEDRQAAAEMAADARQDR